MIFIGKNINFSFFKLFTSHIATKSSSKQGGNHNEEDDYDSTVCKICKSDGIYILKIIA